MLSSPVCMLKLVHKVWSGSLKTCATFQGLCLEQYWLACFKWVLCLQMAKADLAKIAVSLNQAQQVYKALKARRAELSKAVEALQLMGEWQVNMPDPSQQCRKLGSRAIPMLA